MRTTRTAYKSNIKNGGVISAQFNRPVQTDLQNKRDFIRSDGQRCEISVSGRHASPMVRSTGSAPVDYSVSFREEREFSAGLVSPVCVRVGAGNHDAGHGCAACPTQPAPHTTLPTRGTRGREKIASLSSFTLHLRCWHPMTRAFHQTEIAISRPGMSMWPERKGSFSLRIPRILWPAVIP